MFQVIGWDAMMLLTAVTSVMGALCLLRGRQIFDLRRGTRNFMYCGACCAMTSGFIGANLYTGLQQSLLWHTVAAGLLCVVGLCATAHIVVDLSDRLRILKRV